MLKFAFLPLLLLSFTSSAQQGNEAIKKLADDNLRTMQVYNCNMELIRISGEASTPAQWEGVIAKATECLKIDTSAVAIEIRANAWVKKGELTKALADYTYAIAVSKEDLQQNKELNEDFGGAWEEKVKEAQGFVASLYVDRSDVYVMQGNRALAEADLKSALAIDPNDYKAGSNLKDLDKNIAEKAADARAANPKTYADYLFAAEALSRKGKYKEAVERLNAAIAMEPKNAKAFVQRAETKRNLQDQAGAIADFDKAIQLDNKHAAAYAGRGYTYRDQKMWSLAIVDYTVALQQGEKSADLLVARGDANVQLARYEEALKDYSAAQKILPKDQTYTAIALYTGQGDALRLTGKHSEALAAYEKGIALGKTDFISAIYASEAQLGRGKLHAAQGRKTEAQADFNAVLKSIPDHKEAKAELAKLAGGSSAALEGKNAEEWSTQGRKEYSERKYAEAVVSFSKSIKLEPNTAFYYSLRGFAHAAAGNNLAFEGDFEKAIKLSPNDKAVYFLRATVLESKGRKAEAVDDYRRVLKIDPNHAAAKKKLEALGG